MVLKIDCIERGWTPELIAQEYSRRVAENIDWWEKEREKMKSNPLNLKWGIQINNKV